MSAIVTLKRFNPNGYTSTIYVTSESAHDPSADPDIAPTLLPGEPHVLAKSLAASNTW